MAKSSFLYLTTRGWKTGRPHEIEIWFVELAGRFYLISERGERAHWVQNLARIPEVTFRVEGREYKATARLLDSAGDAHLRRRVRDLFQAKYDWSTGVVVELTGELGGPASGTRS